MSQAPVVDAPARGQGAFGVAFRSIVFVALLIGNVFPSIGPVSLATAGAVLAAPLIAYEWLRLLPRIHPYLFFCGVLFASLIIPGLMNVPFTEYGIEKFEKIATVTLLSALAAILIRDRRHVHVMAWVWLTASVILAAATYLGISGSGPVLNDRAATFGANPVWLGRELASGVVIALWLAWRRSLHPLFAVLAIVFIGGALAATESRGPLIGIALAALAFVVIARPRLSQLTWAGMSFLAAGVIAVLYFAPAAMPQRFLELLLSPGDAVDGSQRDQLWSMTVPVIESAPAGIGYGNWQLETGSWARWPHNLFLEVFAEAGWLPGVVVVVAVVVVLVRLVVRARRDPAATLALMMLVKATVEVSVSGDLNGRAFFALLALGFIISTWPRLEESATKEPVARAASRSLPPASVSHSAHSSVGR